MFLYFGNNSTCPIRPLRPIFNPPLDRRYLIGRQLLATHRHQRLVPDIRDPPVQLRTGWIPRLDALRRWPFGIQSQLTQLLGRPMAAITIALQNRLNISLIVGRLRIKAKDQKCCDLHKYVNLPLMYRMLLVLIASLASFAQSFEGAFVGDLQAPNAVLQLGLTLKPNPSGGWSAEFISLSQGRAKLPATATVEGKQLKLDIAPARISFEGTLSEDAQTISGKFKQGIEIDLVFKRVAEIPRPIRPQEPQGTPPYTVEDVTFPGGADTVTLAGTLTLPKSSAKAPAIVLVSGSGPQNRDSELFAHKPFWIWADTLTKAGYIVLRYDDRGTAKSTGTFKGATTNDFALDAQAALKFLRSRPEVDSKRLVVMGHSEGGVIAPIAAASDGQLAAIVVLAGPGVTGEAILRKQLPDLAKAAGAPEQFAQMQLDAMQKQAKTEPWLATFLVLDPAVALKKVQCPVLALNGELDLNVNADINLAAIEAALKAGGNKNYLTRKLPSLNHMLQTAKTGAPLESANISETISPVALTEVTSWLARTLATK